MAAITILRSLNEQGGDIDAPLVSAFTPNSIEFKMERGILTGTYAMVEINTIAFFATLVQVGYEANTDRYLIDLAEILPAFMGVAPLALDVAALSKLIEIDIKGYESDGTPLASNTTHPDINLCFGCPAIGSGGFLDNIYDKGSLNARTTYHNGTLSIYWKGAAVTADLTIDGTASQEVALTKGYNVIAAGVSLQKNGTLTRKFVASDLSVLVNYRAAAADAVEIRWINKEGGWASWAFRQIQKRYVVEKSDAIPVFSLVNWMSTGKSYDLNTSKQLVYDLDTIAVNDEHYAQLCEIAESPRILYNGVLLARIDSISDAVATCKQNLKFNISLKTDENAVSY